MTEWGPAVAALEDIGRGAGLDVAAVREEAERLAAAVAESVDGAPQAWLAATGRASEPLEVFFRAAASARRWRQAPTDLLVELVGRGNSSAHDYAQALTRVISAATDLGEPNLSAIAAASATSRAQLANVPAARAAPVVNHAPRTPASIPHVDSPPDDTESDPPIAKSLEELLEALDQLIGLTTVKAEIKRQTQLLRIDALRAEAGMKTPTLTRHLVFTGNPGTGKTTVARLVSGIYRALGILSAGHLVEVDRSELVAGYLGQTAAKTADVIESARGGVLFIDEAYALSTDQYGTEAVTTLVKDMEDHRGDLVVIVAGYVGPMQDFLDTNPGLASRFGTTIDFPDYSDAELGEIFQSLAAGADFVPTAAAVAAFGGLAAAQERTEAFGNGRWVRNVFDAAMGRHAWRLRDIEEPTLHQLRTLEAADLVDPPDGEPEGEDLADESEALDRRQVNS